MKSVVTRMQNAKDFSPLVKYLATGIEEADIRITNCSATNPMGCVAEIETYLHQPVVKYIILSYKPEQVPTNKPIFADEESVCEEHQLSKAIRVSVIHRHADAVHLRRCCINRV